MSEDVRWGVLGAGWLVEHATAAAIHKAEGAKLYATGARSLDRARATEPEVAYPSYQQVIDDDRVEAIYICLANDAHLEWIEAAIRAGKHVLCEKPLVLTCSEAIAVFALAEQHGVHLVEATWTRWHPRMRRIVGLARAGDLGELIEYRASFTFEGIPEGNYRLFPQHGGGALYDVGIYPLHGLVACLPQVENFDLVTIRSELGGHGVDMTTEASLAWSDQSRAHITCSFARPPEQEFTLIGRDGRVHVPDNEAFASWRTGTTLLVNGFVEEFEPVDAYQVMFHEMSRRIRGEEGWLLPAFDSIRVARTVDLMRGASVGQG